jgi:hypothetical protein
VRGRLEFTREATTSDCFAVLAYSADDGRTWLPLSVPWSTQLSVADLSHVVGGERCLLELFVRDGFTSQRLRARSPTLSGPPDGARGSSRQRTARGWTPP